MRFFLMLMTILALAGCKTTMRPPEAMETKPANAVGMGGGTMPDDPCAEKDPVTKLCK